MYAKLQLNSVAACMTPIANGSTRDQPCVMDGTRMAMCFSFLSQTAAVIDASTITRMRKPRLLANAAALLLLTGTAVCIAADEGRSRQTGSKPNIVLILADNVGYGELGVYGGGILRGAPTPRIDQL